jgi:hypothetical protein
LIALQTPVAERTGVFQSPRVMESSGVAASRTHPGVLWTHNDSGDGPYLYATDLRGRDRGALRVRGADAHDWEEIALGPCPRAVGTGDCLFIGDTGDNSEDRYGVTVYAVREPEPPTSPADTQRVTDAPAVLRLRYPDGPHDVEAAYVSPQDSALYLVSKGRSGPIRLYRVALEGWGADSVITATLVQVLPIEPDPSAGRWITDAAIRGDGGLVTLRTKSDIYFFTPGAGGQLHPAGRPACRIRGLEYQGEAIDFLQDGTFVLTSEADGPKRPGQIHVVRCPDAN